MFSSYIFLIIETFYFIYISKRYTLVHPYSIAYFIAFFYFNSILVDFILFDITPYFRFAHSILVDFKSEVYFEYSIICFFFFTTFFVLAIKEDISLSKIKEDLNNILPIKFKQKSVVYLIIFFFILYNVFITISSFSLTRVEKGTEQTAFNLLFRNSINYTFILFFCIKRDNNFILKLFFLTNIIFLIFSFEREPFIILFLCLLYKFNFLRKKIYLALGVTSLISILFLWKIFYANFLYSGGTGSKDFLINVNDSQFSFAGMDPQASFLMVYDYLQKPLIYKDYFFTYLTGVYYQFERIFAVTNYKTLAEFSSEFYTNSEYGTATSILLESLLNFSYLGPIVVSYFVFHYLKKTIKLKNKFGFGIVVSLLYIISKFMRTEFATLFKLQIIPLLIAIYLLNLILITKQTENE